MKTSEESYRDLIEYSLQGVLVLRSGQVVYANKSAAKIFRYTCPADMVGTHMSTRIASHELARMERYHEARMKGENAPSEYICEGVRKDGTKIWVHTMVHPIKWEGEEAVQVSMIDITDRINTEKYEEKYRGLIEGSIQGVGVHRDGKALFANDEMARIFGYESSQAIMELDSILSLYPEKDYQAHRSRWESRLAGRAVPRSIELQGVKRDGSEVWVQCLATAIHWEGEPAIQGTYIDITERKRAEEN